MERDPAAELLESLKSTQRLPSPPGVALRVLELCKGDDTDVGQVSDAIESDPVLAARLLRFANSAVVGVGREVSSIRQAVMMCGLRAVKMTCLGFSVPDPSLPPACPELDLAAFWRESFVRATLARILGWEFHGIDREEAFSAGLLAKMGQLALATGAPGPYGRAMRATRNPIERIAYEREELGVDHVELGARLLADWDLPPRLVSAVEHQLEPGEAPEEDRPLARTIHLATRLAPLFLPGDKPRPEPDEVSLAVAAVERELGLDEERWREIAARVLREYAEVARVLELQLDTPTQVFDLYGQARDECVRLGLVLQLERTELLHQARANLRLAGRDALTGLANRARFEQRLEELLAGLRRCHPDFSVIVLDVDRFGDLEERHGREASEAMLHAIGDALRSLLRESDLAARLGPDEFGVLAPATGVEGARILAARLRDSLARLTVSPGSEPLSITVSSGVVVSSDYERVPTLRGLLLDADAQLMHSKGRGRNAWTLRGATDSGPAPARAS